MSKNIRLAVQTDETGEQEFEFTARCDMCGMEHEFTAVAEVVKDGPVFLNISVQHTTAMLYGGHSI